MEPLSQRPIFYPPAASSRSSISSWVAKILDGVRYYLAIDIDGFDPSIAPGNGTPSHGGFMYYEVLEIL
jgi:agmatinase